MQKSHKADRKKTTPTDMPVENAANQAVGRKLKALYRSVQEEGIPPRFADLIRQLDSEDGENGGKGKR